MSKIICNAKKKISHMERGQVLVLVAGAAIGIIAVIGLTLDVGLMFIGNARLRRAVDAAALSSALQFREGYNINTLTDSANEFLVLDGFSSPNSTVATCDYNPTNLDLGCVAGQAARKLVGVHATAQINLAFLPIIGINTITISATAVSETASLDVVLAIDRSESMTYGAATGDPMRDPYYCDTPSVNGLSNAQRTYTSQIPDPQTGLYDKYLLTSACQPFFQVIGAAIDFTKILFFPYDQLSIVTFDKDPGVLPGTPPLCNGTRCPNISLNQDCPHGTTGCTPADAVIPALQGLTVFGTEIDPYKIATSSTEDYRCYGPSDGSCSGTIYTTCASTPVLGTGSNYLGLIGQKQDYCLPSFVNPPDPSHYTTTNIGAGLEMAGNELATDSRQDVLWVVILLTDGVPNAGYSDNTTPIYYCPSSTWSNRSPTLPVCDNGDVADDSDITKRPAQTSANYDALSYAYDEADFVGLPYNAVTNSGGQGALLYTIGLGSELTNYVIPGYTDPVTGGTNEGLGTIFLNYAANVGHGLYYAAPSASQLTTIFRSIGSDIATRLAK
jgi:Flp pilus assembly protein TadG